MLKAAALALLIGAASWPALAAAPAAAPPPEPAPREAPSTALRPSDLAIRPPAEAAPRPAPPRPKPATAGEAADAASGWADAVREALEAPSAKEPPEPTADPGATPPAATAPPAPAAPPALEKVPDGAAPDAAPRPRRRPAGLAWSGSAAAVCEDPRLRGEAVAPITDPGACGIPKPVRVTHAGGVALSTPVYLGCPAASALATWLGRAARSAPELLGAELTSAAPFASYACRTRNGRPGGKLSEHARGRAVDIGRFRLSDGRTVTVKSGWDDARTAPFLRRAWRDACGRFGTVLGPEADVHHRDHFHLDVARHRGGPYCR